MRTIIEWFTGKGDNEYAVLVNKYHDAGLACASIASMLFVCLLSAGAFN